MEKAILVEEKLKGKTELEVKRFYLPFKYEKECKCGNKIELNLNEDYLSYPQINTIEKMGMWCEECQTEYEVDIQLELNIVLRDWNKEI